MAAKEKLLVGACRQEGRGCCERCHTEGGEPSGGERENASIHADQDLELDQSLPEAGTPAPTV